MYIPNTWAYEMDIGLMVPGFATREEAEEAAKVAADAERARRRDEVNEEYAAQVTVRIGEVTWIDYGWGKGGDWGWETDR